MYCKGRNTAPKEIEMKQIYIVATEKYTATIDDAGNTTHNHERIITRAFSDKYEAYRYQAFMNQSHLQPTRGTIFTSVEAVEFFESYASDTFLR